MKKNLTTNKNSKLALKKSKNLMNMADKILARNNSKDLDDDEGWMQRLWDWAVENDISSEIIPIIGISNISFILEIGISVLEAEYLVIITSSVFKSFATVIFYNSIFEVIVNPLDFVST